MGLEPTPDEFVAGMVEVFREVRRVLRDDGTLWLNIGDSYANAASGQHDGQAGQARHARALQDALLRPRIGRATATARRLKPKT
jgi:DNA modification methylase